MLLDAMRFDAIYRSMTQCSALAATFDEIWGNPCW